MGSERPENCPVDSFQWRTGGSPGKGVATIEIAEKRRRLRVRTQSIQKKTAHCAVFSAIIHF